MNGNTGPHGDLPVQQSHIGALFLIVSNWKQLWYKMGHSSAMKKKGQTTDPCKEMEESQNFTEQKKLHRRVFNIWFQNLILKFVWNHKRPPDSQSNLEEEEQSWNHHTPWFQTTLQTTVIKPVRYWHQHRHRGQCSRTDSSEISPWVYGQLLLDKGAKNAR